MSLKVENGQAHITCDDCGVTLTESDELKVSGLAGSKGWKFDHMQALKVSHYCKPCSEKPGKELAMRMAVFDYDEQDYEPPVVSTPSMADIVGGYKKDCK